MGNKDEKVLKLTRKANSKRRVQQWLSIPQRTKRGWQADPSERQEGTRKELAHALRSTFAYQAPLQMVS